MTRHLRVYLMSYKQFGALCSGEVRVLNLPSGSECVHHHDCESLQRRTGIAVLFSHPRFEVVPQGVQIPVVNAVFSKIEEPACT